VIELRRGLGRGMEVIPRRTNLGAWQDLHGQHPLVGVTGQVDDWAGWPLEQAVDPELGANSRRASSSLGSGVGASSTATVPPE